MGRALGVFQDFCAKFMQIADLGRGIHLSYWAARGSANCRRSGYKREAATADIEIASKMMPTAA
jgi:hypothetical protein